MRRLIILIDPGKEDNAWDLRIGDDYFDGLTTTQVYAQIAARVDTAMESILEMRTQGDPARVICQQWRARTWDG
jgi:hypothetical protein